MAETYAKVSPPQRVKIARTSETGYFKSGQPAFVLAWDARGGCHRIDGSGVSKRGEVSYLVSKTKEMRGGALWFSADGITFPKGH